MTSKPVFAAFFPALILALGASAQGRINNLRPQGRIAPQVQLTDLAVKTTIVDGTATTQLRQIYRNNGNQIGEGTWVLPLPPGALADRFTMTVNGKEMAGEVLDAGEARNIYEEIVRRQQDPGLLEYMGHGCLRARIFPIPARGEITVLVRFRQLLHATAGLHEWSFPLRAASMARTSTAKISLDLTISSKKAIKAIYSPLAGVDIQAKGDHEARVSFESQAGQMPERDLRVMYGLSDQEFGLNLLTYRKKGDPGFFMMLLAPKQEWKEPENTQKIIHFVLDTSGSMAGKKIDQARGALSFFLKSLKPHDLFNVVPFSTEARPFFPAPVAASAENRKKAMSKAAELVARGGTNIEDGLRSALCTDSPSASNGASQMPITVFLTDGLPSVGTTDTDQLITLVKKFNKHGARIFVFGVGHDVNTKLLDRIAEDAGGDRDYVRENENIEVKTGALFTKLSHPVMTDLQIACKVIDNFDTFPKRTPDLFKGGRLVVIGRYRNSGNAAIHLKGCVDGSDKEFIFEGTFPEDSTEHDFLPVLWAERKIGVILEAIRLHGRKQELVDEVTRLGKEYGIVTPFTSHLVLEEGMRVAQDREVWKGGKRRPEIFLGTDTIRVEKELGRAGADPSGGLTEIAEKAKEQADASRRTLSGLGSVQTGRQSVAQSQSLKALKRGRAPTAEINDVSESAGNLLRRRIKDHTFYLAGGVWVDSQYTAKMKSKVKKVKAFSKEYFELLKQQPEIVPFLAFSTRIVIVTTKGVIEIV